MTVTEMINSFGLKYTSEINLAVPGWENTEIVSFLNTAQLDIVDELYRGQGAQPLQELIRVYPVSAIDEYTIAIRPIKNAQYFKITHTSTPWRFLISMHAGVTRTDTGEAASDKMLLVSSISVPQAERLIETPFNTPYFRELYYYLTEEDPGVPAGAAALSTTTFGLISDAFSTVSDDFIEVRYLKKPLPLAETLTGDGSDTVVSELHDKYHDMIVDRAVTLTIEALMNPRIKTQPQVV